MRNAIDALDAVKSRARVALTAIGARRMRSNAELLEQEALIQWAALTIINGRRVGNYLLHVPN
ncbi:hypothetical protein [Pseudescherichia vulneris]|uniref:hypothetical protein n=1 Tax=Pseudescherichia vulneris TaxID=566 RepID=UPI003019A059